MKHVIAMGLLVMIGLTIVVVGLWHQNEQRKQFDFQQINAMRDRDNKPPINGTDQNNLDQDPFGLFGPDEVVYEITFQTQWTEENHPGYHIRSAHFSPPVVWVGPNNPVFELGGKASQGMMEMAETGRTSDLKSELELLEIGGEISSFAIYERVETPDTQTYQVTVNRENPVVSLVSMIAPTPDWFVAIEGLNLLEQGTWKREETIQTLALDAGTEEGDDFKISNPATDPQGTISELTDIPSRSLKPFVVVKFKQLGYEGE